MRCLGECQCQRREDQERESGNDPAPNPVAVEDGADQRGANGHADRLNGPPLTDEVFAETKLEQIEVEDQFDDTVANVGQEVVEEEEFDVRSKTLDSSQVAVHHPCPTQWSFAAGDT